MIIIAYSLFRIAFYLIHNWFANCVVYWKYNLVFASGLNKVIQNILK